MASYDLRVQWLRRKVQQGLLDEFTQDLQHSGTNVDLFAECLERTNRSNYQLLMDFLNDAPMPTKASAILFYVTPNRAEFLPPPPPPKVVKKRVPKQKPADSDPSSVPSTPYGHPILMLAQQDASAASGEAAPPQTQAVRPLLGGLFNIVSG
jgi:hypothetical protein